MNHIRISLAACAALLSTSAVQAQRIAYTTPLASPRPTVSTTLAAPTLPPRTLCAHAEDDAREQVAVRSNLSITEPPRLTFTGLSAAGGTGTTLLTTQTAQSSSSSHAFPTDEKTAGPLNHTHRIHGKLWVDYKERGPDIVGSIGNDDYPQYADVAVSNDTRALSRMNIVLEDTCGHYIKGATTSTGAFDFEWTPVGCASGTITVWSVTASGPSAAVGKWVGGAIDDIDELTSDSSDYRAFSHSWSFNIAAAAKAGGGLDVDYHVPSNQDAGKAFFTLLNAVDAKAYFTSIPGVGSLPRLNIEYTPGVSLDDGDWEYAQYRPSVHPGFIHIPAAPYDYGVSRFAHLHEVAHVFERHYMREGSYGRIGEPLANAYATIIQGSPWFDKNSSFESIDVQANFKNGAMQGAEWSFGHESATCTEYFSCKKSCDGDCEAECGSHPSCDDLIYSYGWTQRVLWDLADEDGLEPLATWIPEGENELHYMGDDFDLTGSEDAFNKVITGYLGGGVYGDEHPLYDDRGLVGVDLIDVLDGFICHGASSIMLELIVNEAMDFGYEPPGAAGACIEW